MNIWTIIFGLIVVLFGIWNILELNMFTPGLTVALIFFGLIIIISGFLNKKR